MRERLMKNFFSLPNFIASIVFSLFWGFANLLSKKIIKVSTGEMVYQDMDLFRFKSQDIITICAGILVGLIIYFALSLVLVNFKSYNEKKASSRKLFVISFIMSFLWGGMQLLVLNPGCVMSDSVIIINGSLGLRHQHPMIYILYLAGIVRGIADITGSISIGMFVFSLIQLALCSLVIAYTICWLAQKGINRVWIILLVAYYSMFPLIGNYNITAIKDTVFAYLLVLVTISFYEIMATKGAWLSTKKNIVCFSGSFLGLSVIRNNGVYVCIVLLVILLFALPKHYKKLVGIYAIVFMVINTGISKTSNNMPMESLAIPIQQTAMAIVKSDNVTEQQKEIVSNMLPYDEWELYYLPFAVDTIKWNPNVNKDWLNANNDVFVRNWLEMLPKNFNYYVEAFLYQTFGLWNTDLIASDSRANYGQSRFVPDYLYVYTNSINGKQSPVTHKQIIPMKAEQFLNQIYWNANFLGGGQCFWIMIALCCIALSKKNFRTIWGMLPTIGVVGTLFISTPLSLAFRYTFFYVLLLPVFIFLLNINVSKEDETL